MKALCIMVLAIALVAIAQAPKPAPTPALPAIDSASAAILAPIATQRQAALAAKVTAQKALDKVSYQWQVAAMAAVKKAGLDTTKVTVDPTGKKFVQFRK